MCLSREHGEKAELGVFPVEGGMPKQGFECPTMNTHVSGIKYISGEYGVHWT